MVEFEPSIRYHPIIQPRLGGEEDALYSVGCIVQYRCSRQTLSLEEVEE